MPQFGLCWSDFDFDVVTQPGKAIHQLALRQIGEVTTYHVGDFGLLANKVLVKPQLGMRQETGRHSVRTIATIFIAAYAQFHWARDLKRY